jgi:hypothetical protein
MLATWDYGVNNSLKMLSQTELYKLFRLPAFKICFSKKPFYEEYANSLRLAEYTVETTTTLKVRTHFALFLCDLSIPANHEEWLYYTTCKGGSALSLGPTFTYNPSIAAQQVAFWLPLEQWCRFPQNQLQFRKQFTMTFVIDRDNVPSKTKRVWLKKFLKALEQYKDGNTCFEPDYKYKDTPDIRARAKLLATPVNAKAHIKRTKDDRYLRQGLVRKKSKRDG